MNDKSVTLQFKNSVTNLKRLEQYENRLNSLKKTMESMPKDLDIGLASKKTDDFNKNLDKSQEQLKTLGEAIKFGAIVKGFRDVTSSISKYTSKTADFVENINLMNVAFHRTQDTMEEANLAGTKLVNTLSEMYGIDESYLTRTVGIFKQLSNAMNITDDVGTRLSETLTQLTIDTASLYNLSFERASSVLQSALAGQTKPVRGAFGADITETTLQVTLDSYGIDSTVRELSYAEKRLIIVTSLLNQLSEAQNDAGRTIESVSNQMRVFNEQTQRLSRAIGSVFLPILETILPYMNAILMVLTEIISTFAIFVGYNEDMMAGFASGDVTEGIWDLDNALTSAGNSAKKLKQGLRSFDKLNVITTPSSGGGAGGGAGAIGGINPDVLNAFNSATEEYQRRLEKIQMKATKIRDSIMEWLGFTKEVDEETGKVSFKFDHITSGTVLGAMAVGGIIYSGAKKTLGFLNKIGLIKFGNFKDFSQTIFTLFSNKSNMALLSSTSSKLATNTKNTASYTSLVATNTKNIEKNTGSITKSVLTTTTKTKDLSNHWYKVTTFATNFKNTLVGVATAGTGLFILSDSIKDINENGFGLLNTIGLISGSLMSVGGIFKTITSTASLFGVTMSSSMTIATGGLSLLIPLVVGFITHINNASNDTSKFNNKLKEINETFKQLDKTAKEQVSTNQVQINRTQDLVRELENLIDANGKIKEGYEDRTKYILNYVNEALGTEYKLVGNVITQNGKVVKSYKNIQSETQKLINLRKTELVLEAYKDKYVEALKQENNLKNEILDKQLKVNQKQLEYNEYVRQGKDENSSFMISLRNEIAQLEEEKKKQENALAGFQYVIRNYEALQEAHITGSVEKTNELIRKVMTETEISATNTTNNIKKNLDQKFSNFNYNINFNANKTPQFSSFERNLGNLKATVNVDANTTNAQKKINNLGNSLATSFKVAINYDKKYSKIDISGISQNADGGMPPVGQLFIANEKGPEMIGHIGGRSFVANQNQMMDLLDKKIGNAQKNSKGIQNATFIVKFGEEEIARKVINDLEDMADYNGKPIVIGG